MKTNYETFEELKDDYVSELHALLNTCDENFKKVDQAVRVASNKLSEVVAGYDKKPIGIGLAMFANRCALESANVENAFRDVSLTIYENLNVVRLFKESTYLLVKNLKLKISEEELRELVK